MDGWNFVDLATKAKELGISDGTLRARLFDGDPLAFTYLTRCRARGSKTQWLPVHNADRFPMVDWVDHGSAFRRDDENDPRDGWPPNRTPCYHITGWVALPQETVATILTRGDAELDYMRVGVFDADSRFACELVVNVAPRREWVSADSYEDGGYWRETSPVLTPADIFMRAADDTAQKPLSSRKEQSYLGIVAAMRALLRDKDGGGFPSDAKIIELLVDRYKAVDGISKRNLESVFADATRTTADLLAPK